MEKTRLGKTDLMVSRTAFGGIPIQRITFEESTAILKKAYASGMNFYDTARGYGTSEKRIGEALGDVRENVIIATKSFSATGKELRTNLETSLKELNTDYIDLFQFHNPSQMPKPGASDGVYDEALAAKKEGLIRHIGITAHSLEYAKELVTSGLYETMQFPLSLLSSDEEIKFVELCKEHDVGFIAMKAMAGGLITNAKVAFSFLRRFENVVPIWGIQFMWELEEFLQYEAKPPKLDDELWDTINQYRKDLAIDFCRACGYCMPCSEGINIPMAVRAELLVGRMPLDNLVNENFQAMMQRIKNCTNCGHCIKHCPYKLDIPPLLHKHLAFYEGFIEEYNNKK